MGFGDGRYAHEVEELAAELRQEFLDEVRDGLKALALHGEEVRHGRRDIASLVSEVHRFALPLPGQADNFGARLIGDVARRMADYLANAKEPPPRLPDDLDRFIDVMTDIVEGRIAFDSDAAGLVRGLPAKAGFTLGEIEVRNVEVMLVMLHGAAAHFVERELQQCGYRVTTVSSSFEALPLIVRTKPDLVIVSAVMPELDGLDLAIGLSAMPETRNIPVAVITSLADSDEHLKLLPAHVPVIHKGTLFGDDLFRALDNLFLI